MNRSGLEWGTRHSHATLWHKLESRERKEVNEINFNSLEQVVKLLKGPRIRVQLKIDVLSKRTGLYDGGGSVYLPHTIKTSKLRVRPIEQYMTCQIVCFLVFWGVANSQTRNLSKWNGLYKIAELTVSATFAMREHNINWSTWLKNINSRVDPA